MHGITEGFPRLRNPPRRHQPPGRQHWMEAVPWPDWPASGAGAGWKPGLARDAQQPHAAGQRAGSTQGRSHHKVQCAVPSGSPSLSASRSVKCAASCFACLRAKLDWKHTPATETLSVAQVLQKVRGTKKVEVELTEIKRAVSKAEASKASMVLFRRRRHLPQLLWCIAMPVMQQYTGMNAFMFYGGCSAVQTQAQACTCHACCPCSCDASCFYHAPTPRGVT